MQNDFYNDYLIYLAMRMRIRMRITLCITTISSVFNSSVKFNYYKQFKVQGCSHQVSITLFIEGIGRKNW
jgi:hypothetical protein